MFWVINKFRPISPGKIILDEVVELCVLSRVQLFATPWVAARQTSLSVGFPRQEYLSGLPFPTPGDLPDQRLNPHLLHLMHWQADSLPTASPGKLYG